MLFRSEHVELKSTLPLCLHFKQVLICTEVMGKLALSVAKKQINSSPKKSSHNFLEKKKNCAGHIKGSVAVTVVVVVVVASTLMKG